MFDRVGKEAFVMLVAVVIGFLAAGRLGAAICGVLAVVIALVLWTPLRGWLGIPAKRSLDAFRGRVGYRGHAIRIDCSSPLIVDMGDRDCLLGGENPACRLLRLIAVQFFMFLDLLLLMGRE